jgi:hypothetical protein
LLVPHGTQDRCHGKTMQHAHDGATTASQTPGKKG